MKMSSKTVASVLAANNPSASPEDIERLIQEMERHETQAREEERAQRTTDEPETTYDKVYLLPGGTTAFAVKVDATGDGDAIASIRAAAVENNETRGRRGRAPVKILNIQEALERGGKFRKALKTSPAKILKVLTKFSAVETATPERLGLLWPQAEEPENGQPQEEQE